MQVEIKNLLSIKENKANPRVIKDAKFHKLVNSLLVLPKMLELRPIVGDKGVALGGNQRYKALQFISSMDEAELLERLNSCREYLAMPLERQEKLNQFWLSWLDNPTAPYIEASELTDDEKTAFIVKDNAPFGEWDWDELANTFDEVQLDEWGVDCWQMPEEKEETESKQAKEDDFDEEKDAIQVRCKRGDVWQLGEHRLMCGDSIDLEDVKKLMGGV